VEPRKAIQVDINAHPKKRKTHAHTHTKKEEEEHSSISRAPCRAKHGAPLLSKWVIIMYQQQYR